MKYDFDTLIVRRNMGASKWRLMEKFDKALPEDIVPLSVADMEFKTAPEIVQGLKDYIDSSILGYTRGTDTYYKAVCSFMERKHNWKIDKAWILAFSGVVPALYAIVKALTNPSDGVIIMTPVYYPFYGAVDAENREILRNELKLCGDHYEIDFEDLEEKARLKNTKLLFLCNPHNPVGRVWSREELERLGRICIDNNVLVVSDEIHFDLIMPGYEHTVFASISEEFQENSITCTAPSKTFNLAGLQASNIIISNKKVRELVEEKRRNDGYDELNILGYKACEVAYTECDGWLNELINTIEFNRKLLVEFITKNIPKIKIINLEGTYLQWLDFREFGMSSSDLEKFMKEEAQLFLDEGYIFGKQGEGFERINIACPTKVLEAALNRLKCAIQRLDK
jgi:putative C-S lyase